MKKRKFNRAKRPFRFTESQRIIVAFCQLAVPQIRNVIGYRAGQCVFENKILSVILHDFGMPTRVVSGEAVLLNNGYLSIDHADSFDGNTYSWHGNELSLVNGAGGLPISHHTWLVSENNLVIDISVGSYPENNMDCLYGPSIHGLPKIQRNSTMSWILRQTEKCNINTTVWSYREYEPDEYIKNAQILDQYLGHTIGVKYLKINSNELVDEWLLGDSEKIQFVNEISGRIQNDLTEIINQAA